MTGGGNGSCVVLKEPTLYSMPHAGDQTQTSTWFAPYLLTRPSATADLETQALPICALAMASSALRGVAKRVVALTTRQQGVFLRHSGVMASTAPMLARAHSSSSSSGGDATMKAIVVTEWVNPEAIGDSLVPTTVPAPDIDDGCVKVAVAAAGASECGACVTHVPYKVYCMTCLCCIACLHTDFFDILMMAGKYQIKPPLPFVPGTQTDTQTHP